MTNKFVFTEKTDINRLKCKLVADQKKVKLVVVLLSYWLIFAAIERILSTFFSINCVYDSL